MVVAVALLFNAAQRTLLHLVEAVAVALMAILVALRVIRTEGTAMKEVIRVLSQKVAHNRLAVTAGLLMVTTVAAVLHMLVVQDQTQHMDQEVEAG